MKKLKMIALSCIMAIMLLVPGGTALAVFPEPTANFYVNDLAGVLSQSDYDSIFAINDELAGSGAQIVVLTVDFLGGMNIDDYALEVFNRWEIGDSVRNNGVLILLAIAEEDYFVATGSGLESVIPSGQVQVILNRYMEPYFAAGEYGTGVQRTAEAIGARLLAHYGTTGAAISAPADIQPDISHGEATAAPAAGRGMSGTLFIFFIIVIMILVLSSRRTMMMGPMGRPMRRRWFGWGWGGPWMWGWGGARHRRAHWNNRQAPPPGGGGRTPTGGGRSSGGGAGRSGGFGGGYGGLGGGFGGGRGGFGGGGRSSGGGAGRGR